MSNSEHVTTIVSMAKRAKLSPATVSSVLSGKAKKFKISDETAERVKKIAVEMNYQPNSLARSLVLQKSGGISIIFAHYMYNWIQSFMDGAEPSLDKASFIPFITAHKWDSKRERQELLTAIQRRDEGVFCVLLPGEKSKANYSEFSRYGVPLVLLGDTLEGLDNVSSVAWDSGPAARVAMEHLIQIGRRRIGFIGLKHRGKLTQMRVEAYRDVLSESGLPINKKWSYISPLVSPPIVTKESIGHMFGPGQVCPDAFFCLDDSLAFPLLKILAELGLRVPDDVAVIGMCDLHGPSLSSVREPLVEMGKMAVEILLDHIRNPGKPPVHLRIPCTELKIRNTTGGIG
jgi:LacI family transcriptional regulator